jgi:hypothetical protein
MCSLMAVVHKSRLAYIRTTPLVSKISMTQKIMKRQAFDPCRFHVVQIKRETDKMTEQLYKLPGGSWITLSSIKKILVKDHRFGIPAQCIIVSDGTHIELDFVSIEHARDCADNIAKLVNEAKASIPEPDNRSQSPPSLPNTTQ